MFDCNVNVLKQLKSPADFFVILCSICYGIESISFRQKTTICRVSLTTG